jgi:hypothetical protein
LLPKRRTERYLLERKSVNCHRFQASALTFAREWAPALAFAGILASLVSPALAATKPPLPDLIDKNGFLLFVSRSQLELDWATGEVRKYSTRFEESAPEINGLLTKLDQAVQPPGGNSECGAAVPPPDTDDEQAGAGDVRIRSIGSEISAIGVVDAISPGWSATFDAPVQLVRLTVATLFKDGRHHLVQGSDLLVLVPGGSMLVSNRSLCVERGWWPVFELGDRVLVSGFWRFLPAGLVAPMDLVPIRHGQLLLEAPLRGGVQNPSRMTEAELEAWWQERKRPR